MEERVKKSCACVDRTHRSSVGSIFNHAAEEGEKQQGLQGLNNSASSGPDTARRNRRYAHQRAGSSSSVQIGHDAEKAQYDRIRASVMYQMEKEKRADSCPFGRTDASGKLPTASSSGQPVDELGLSRKGARSQRSQVDSTCPFGTERDAITSEQVLAQQQSSDIPAATTSSLFGGMRDGERSVVPSSILREIANKKAEGAAGVKSYRESFTGFDSWNNAAPDYASTQTYIKPQRD